MIYSIFEKKSGTEIKVSGKISKSAVIESGTFIRSIIERGSPNITLDIDGLEDEREMIYHIALINSFKKAVDYAGGIFILISNSKIMKNYLSKTGLEKIFPVSTINSIQKVISHES